MRVTISRPARRRSLPVAALALALVLGVAAYTFAASLSIDNKVGNAVNAFHAGDTVTYEERVTNTNLNPATLTVAFTYPDGTTEVLDPAGMWAIGESRTYTRTYVVTGAEPVVTVAGAERFSSELHAYGREQGTADRIDLRASKSSQILKPAIAVQTTVDFDGDGTFSEAETYYPGSGATWKIVVTNTGNCALTTTLSELTGYDFGAAFALEPGESRTVLVTGVISADSTNIATASGTDVAGGVVSAVDGAAADVIRPALSVSKTVEYTDQDSIFTDHEVGMAGGTATWRVVVANTGDSALSDVRMTDSNGHDFGAPFALGAGAEHVFEYQTPIEAAVTDSVTASATDVLGGAVGPATDSAQVTLIAPAIGVKKSVDFDADGIFSDDSETNWAGLPALWKIVVSNTGDIALTGVTVTDTNGRSFGPIAELAPGASQTFTYATVPTADTLNTASATGAYAGGTVSASDSASVVARAIDARLSVKKYIDFDADGVFSDDTEDNYAWRTAKWRIVVTNDGASPLKNVIVYDSNGKSFSAATLAPGASQSWQYVSYPRTTTVNTANATARAVDGSTVTAAPDAATARVVLPASIAVKKYVSFDNVAGYSDSFEVGLPGTDATWKIVVTNNGQAPLEDVEVTDTNGRSWTIARLAPYTSQTFTYVTPRVTNDILNVATAEADTTDGREVGPVSDYAKALVSGPLASVKVKKYVEFDGDGIYSDGTEVGYLGSTAKWRIVVTNDGEAKLTDVYVRDSNGRAFTVPLLLPGESKTFEYTTIINAPTTNTVTVKAKAPNCVYITGDPDSGVVEAGLISKLGLKKYIDYNGDGVYSDVSETNVAGSTAHWRIVVTNVGTAAVKDIRLADSQTGQRTIALLQPGESRAIDYTTVPTNSYTNLAFAYANAPSGLPLPMASDTATAQMIGGYGIGDITVKKYVDFNGDGVYSDELEWGVAGTEAKWRITVTNNHPTQTVRYVGVLDWDGGRWPLRDLKPGETRVIDYAKVIYADYTNYCGGAVSSPEMRYMGTLYDKATAKVLPAAITIEKQVRFGDACLFTPEQTGYAGSQALWRIIVKNTGETDLYNVVVNDSNGKQFTLASLPRGASKTWDYFELITGNKLNTATVNAATIGGVPVEPRTAWASVKVLTGTVAVEAEEYVDFDSDGVYSDLGETAPAGSIARWKAEVRNTGDYVLYDIVLRDVFGMEHTISELAPGEERAFESTSAVNQTTVNTVTVTARGPSWLPLPPATDDAAAIVGPVTP